MKETVLNIATRGGPEYAIEIYGQQPGQTEPQTYYFDRNLEGAHRLMPGHRASFIAGRGNWITKIVRVVNLQTKRPVSLTDDALPAGVMDIEAVSERFHRFTRQKGPRVEPVIAPHPMPKSVTAPSRTRRTDSTAKKPGRYTRDLV